MDKSKIDPKKKAKPAKAAPDEVKAELSEEQLSDVSGGLLKNCVAGAHYKKVIIE